MLTVPIFIAQMLVPCQVLKEESNILQITSPTVDFLVNRENQEPLSQYPF